MYGWLSKGNMKTARVLLTVLLGLASQPLLAQKVEIRCDDEFDYFGLETFAWRHSKDREKNVIRDQQIVSSVNYHLVMGGLRQVEPGEEAHAYFSYFANSESGVILNSAELGIDPAVADASVGLLLQRRPTYERGSLVLQARTPG